MPLPSPFPLLPSFGPAQERHSPLPFSSHSSCPARPVRRPRRHRPTPPSPPPSTPTTASPDVLPARCELNRCRVKAVGVVIVVAMASSECPIWIDPDNSFRLDINVRKYVADGEYGLVEMADQQHDVWLDRNWQYTLRKFNDSMATKIIWGPSQALSVWAVDSDSGSEWKIRRDEHFAQLIKARWDERVAALVVDVVRLSNDGQRSDNGSNFRSFVSGVTTGDCSAFHGNARGSGSIPDNVEGTADTCSSPPPAPPSMPDPIPVEVDWASLTIEQLLEDDGFAHAAADEDKVYEAMGFQAADERAEEAARRVQRRRGRSEGLQQTTHISFVGILFCVLMCVGPMNL